ncbi:hypothetical protein Glove_217g140 [Diversispora epigaea]|uniref:Protein kinase domain-containing protein n=1 Tax=Diversispora epigaea TaxID=1348612 RepID=A0A397IPU8_9GLOM|nr:hypothetical protein Glove_217g140 [Diversispora epigaea]
MSQEKTNEKELGTWMDNLIIDSIFKKENVPFYQYSEFQNVKLINANIFKATFKSSQNTVALKNVYLNYNDKFTLDKLINEIKRHRKLEIHDSILKFYGITKQEYTKNYMIILEYVNEGSLRQYLKSNFLKLDWNKKLNLALQIANVLMFLHSNDIIHERFNSENIFIHNGIIKLNVFGLSKFLSDSLSLFTNALGPIQYMDSQYFDLFSTIGKNKSSDIFGLGIILWEISNDNSPFEMEYLSNVDFLNNFSKAKREIAIPGTPHKYKEIYTDCWKPNKEKNSRPDIFQVVKNLSEIIISDSSIKFETPRSQPYKIIDEIKLEKLKMQNEEPEIKPDSSFFDATTEVNVFIKDLLKFLIFLLNSQYREIRPIKVKNYIREHKKNPVEIMHEMIRHPSYHWFTGLIGFFYQNGIGTVVDNQMAFKFFNLASNEIIDTSSNSSYLRKLYNINKEIGIISLASVYLHGIGVEKDTKKAFRIFCKFADKGSLIALNSVAYCYHLGVGIERNEEKAFELYLKSAKKGIILAQSNVGICYEFAKGTKKDEVQGFQWYMKVALSESINAMLFVGFCYENGIGVGRDEREAFKWFLKAAEKEHNEAQYNLGICYECGYGIDRDEVKAFEWYKKGAENGFANGQYRLGKFFYEGRGTKKDIINAIYWLGKSKENGNIPANELLREIIDNMIYNS